jgi:hypothetical protein
MSDGGAQALVAIGRALAPVIGPVIRIAVRSFFRTTFGLVLIGLGVLTINWYWAAQVGPLHSWLSLTATLLLFYAASVGTSIRGALLWQVVQQELCSSAHPKGLPPSSLRGLSRSSAAPCCR